MTEDWLPHPPSPQPVEKGNQAVKTLIIWVTLVAFFVIILLTSTSKGDRAAAAGYSGWWIVLAAVVGFALPILLLVWQYGKPRQFNAAQQAGLRAIAESNHERAAVVFREVSARYRGKLSFRTVADYNVGYALVRCGRSAEAVGVLLGVERTPKLAMGGIRQLVAIELARAFAIGGDVDKAARWLASARERTGESGDPGVNESRIEAVEALLLCRQGKLDEARRHHERVWSLLEAYLAVNQMREQWLLRAFAAASQAGPRDAAAADPWLRMLRPMPPGTLDWLATHWPELDTFLAAHDLTDVTKVA